MISTPRHAAVPKLRLAEREVVLSGGGMNSERGSRKRRVFEPKAPNSARPAVRRVYKSGRRKVKVKTRPIVSTTTKPDVRHSRGKGAPGPRLSPRKHFSNAQQAKKTAESQKVRLRVVDTFATCKGAIFDSRKNPPQPFKTALTPSQTLQEYRAWIADYEMGEILDFKSVFYVGTKLSKKNRVKIDHKYTFDDAKGDYLHENQEHVCYRYEVLGLLGRGSFGRVLRVFDHKAGKSMALKIIRSQKKFQRQATVEMDILKHIRENDDGGGANIIHICNSMMFRGHLCMTFDVLACNLYEHLKENRKRGLTSAFIRDVGWQLTQCLAFLNQHDIIHCDLKPENIMLVSKKRSQIKVIDFGSSCFKSKKIYTYIQSRFYRSPEVMLGLEQGYGTEIDWWSLGCILVELVSGYPIFPGENETELMQMIMEVLGVPPSHMVIAASRRNRFFDSKGAPLPRSKKAKGKVRIPDSLSVKNVLKTNDRYLLDFVERCLRWDPAMRIRPSAALDHRLFASATRMKRSSNNKEPAEVRKADRAKATTRSDSIEEDKRAVLMLPKIPSRVFGQQ